MNLRTFLLLVSPTLALMAVFGCSGDSEGGNPGGNRLMPAVEAVQAKYGSLPLTERLSGVIRARNQVEIYPQISAVVVEVPVENGHQIRRGQTLLRLRDNEFRERLKQAEAGLRIAEAQAKQAEARMKEMQAELNRAESLAEKNLITPTELESARTEAISAEADFELAGARVAQSNATVDERQEALSQTVIQSPVNGTVGNRNAEIGMFVSPGTRLFTVGQLDTVRAGVVLTDRMLEYIKSGQRAEIFASEGPISARLSRISPFLHPVTHSTDAEIDIPNPDRSLLPGQFVAVDIFYGESKQATLVPLSALYENPRSGATGVFIAADSLTGELAAVTGTDNEVALSNPVSFTFVPVEVIARGRMVAGIRGVDPDRWVVTLGQDLLTGESSTARVRPVDWRWVERLQNLQREDLLNEIIREQQAAVGDSSTIQF